MLFTSLICTCKTNTVDSQSTYKSNQIVTIEIPSNLGQGYQWQLTDTTSCKVIQHDSKPNPNNQESSDIEIFKLKFGRKGSYHLTFHYVRPFDSDIDTSGTKKFIKKIIIK